MGERRHTRWKAAIIAYLRTSRPSTPREIARGIGGKLNTVQTILANGVTVFERVAKREQTNLWGLLKDGKLQTDTREVTMWQTGSYYEVAVFFPTPTDQNPSAGVYGGSSRHATREEVATAIENLHRDGFRVVHVRHVTVAFLSAPGGQYECPVSATCPEASAPSAPAPGGS